jgi:hypothetical protein
MTLPQFPEFNSNWPNDLRVEWIKAYAAIHASSATTDTHPSTSGTICKPVAVDPMSEAIVYPFNSTMLKIPVNKYAPDSSQYFAFEDAINKIKSFNSSGLTNVKV